MKYIVIEIQTNNGTVSTLTNQYDTPNEAEAKYHLILASAAVSQIETHSAIILTEQAFPIEYKCYEHKG